MRSRDLVTRATSDAATGMRHLPSSDQAAGFRDAYEAQLSGEVVTLDEFAVIEERRARAVRETYAAWGDVVVKIHSSEADLLAKAGAVWGPRIVRLVIVRDGNANWTWRLVRGNDLLRFQVASTRDEARREGSRAAAAYVRDAELVPIEEVVPAPG